MICDSPRRRSSSRRSERGLERRPPERKPERLSRLDLRIYIDPSIDGRPWRVNLPAQGPYSLLYVRRHIPDCGHRQNERTTPRRRPRGVRPPGVPARGPMARDVCIAPGEPRRPTADTQGAPSVADPIVAGRTRADRGLKTNLGDRENDFAELFPAAEVLVGRPSLLQGEDPVDDRFESPHEHEFHDLVELSPARHRRPQDGELPPEQVPRVEFEHGPGRRPRDDHPTS